MSRFVVDIELEDEDGKPETWTVKFKRLTAADWLEVAIPLGKVLRLDAEGDSDPDRGENRIRLIHELFVRSVLAVYCDDKEHELEMVPFDVEAGAYLRHPAFRLPEEVS